MHRQRRVEPDVGKVVNVVLFEGPAMAHAKGEVLLAAVGVELLQEGAADNMECASGLAVVMPSIVCSGRPGQEPDLQAGVGVELDPL